VDRRSALPGKEFVEGGERFEWSRFLGGEGSGDDGAGRRSGRFFGDGRFVRERCEGAVEFGGGNGFGGAELLGEEGDAEFLDEPAEGCGGGRGEFGDGGDVRGELRGAVGVLRGVLAPAVGAELHRAEIAWDVLELWIRDAREEIGGQERGEVAIEVRIRLRVDEEGLAERENFAQEVGEARDHAAEIGFGGGEGGGEGGGGNRRKRGTDARGIGEPAAEGGEGVSLELVERGEGGDERAEGTEGTEVAFEPGEVAAEVEFEQAGERGRGLGGGFFGGFEEAESDAAGFDGERGEGVDGNAGVFGDGEAVGEVAERPGGGGGFLVFGAGLAPERRFGGDAFLRTGVGSGGVGGFAGSEGVEGGADFGEVARGDDFAAAIVGHADAHAEVFGKRFIGPRGGVDGDAETFGDLESERFGEGFAAGGEAIALGDLGGEGFGGFGEWDEGAAEFFGERAEIVFDLLFEVAGDGEIEVGLAERGGVAERDVEGDAVVGLAGFVNVVERDRAVFEGERGGVGRGVGGGCIRIVEILGLELEEVGIGGAAVADEVDQFGDGADGDLRFEI
jgi:hypothetical protein